MAWAVRAFLQGAPRPREQLSLLSHPLTWGEAELIGNSVPAWRRHGTLGETWRGCRDGLQGRVGSAGADSQTSGRFSFPLPERKQTSAVPARQGASRHLPSQIHILFGILLPELCVRNMFLFYLEINFPCHYLKGELETL